MKSLKLTWYGRCCFLVESEGYKILFDPYDDFGHTSIGQIDADYMVISSIAHDHGNIAACPKAYSNGYRGRYTVKEGVYFNGIESKEGRGTLNLIGNVELEPFYLTNFADWGDPECLSEFTDYERSLLQKTNIAFLRTREQEKHPDQRLYDLVMQVCTPRILVPHHHFPESFYKKYIDPQYHHICYEKLREIDDMVEKLPEYTKKEIDSYECVLSEQDLLSKTILVFSEIHPQVVHEDA
jgi:hypothetical protein